MKGTKKQSNKCIYDDPMDVTDVDLVNVEEKQMKDNDQHEEINMLRVNYCEDDAWLHHSTFQPTKEAQPN